MMKEDDADDPADDADHEANDADDSDLAAHADVSGGVGASPQRWQHLHPHSLRQRLGGSLELVFKDPCFVFFCFCRYYTSYWCIFGVF